MPLKILLLDNYDSFTYMLKDYLEQCGANCVVFRNDKVSIQELENASFDAIVISPGPKEPNDAGIVMELIATFYQSIPILGICLGHQALAQFFGAKLIRSKTPRHGKVDMMIHFDNQMFNSIPKTFTATRYHSLIINNLPAELIPTCMCADELMAFKHNKQLIWGVQFHPESCQTSYGLQIVQNFLTLVKEQKLHTP